MRTTTHYPFACTDCGVGLTDGLAYRLDGDAYCQHCYPGMRGPGRSGVAPDPGLPVR